MNKKAMIILVLLASGCADMRPKEKNHAYGAKFTGEHFVLASCVVRELQSDSRWLIRDLVYDVRRYPDIRASEISAYPPGKLPGRYARNSPGNPDAVISYGPPVVSIQAYQAASGTRPDPAPGYAFSLMIKRTDDTTVFATLKGKKYESDIAWAKLKICADA